MSAVDFWIELTGNFALVHRETETAHSVAYALGREGAYPARVSHSGCGAVVLRTLVDDLDDVVADLERWGCEVQKAQCVS
jgi:hypothetical protein